MMARTSLRDFRAISEAERAFGELYVGAKVKPPLRSFFAASRVAFTIARVWRSEIAEKDGSIVFDGIPLSKASIALCAAFS